MTRLKKQQGNVPEVSSSASVHACNPSCDGFVTKNQMYGNALKRAPAKKKPVVPTMGISIPKFVGRSSTAWPAAAEAAVDKSPASAQPPVVSSASTTSFSQQLGMGGGGGGAGGLLGSAPGAARSGSPSTSVSSQPCMRWHFFMFICCFSRLIRAFLCVWNDSSLLS